VIACPSYSPRPNLPGDFHTSTTPEGRRERSGIDPGDPIEQNAKQLVEADEKLLDDLIELRREQGLSQVQVAERLGVHQSSVARIESGERDPHLSTLRRYALALGARVEHHVLLFDPADAGCRCQCEHHSYKDDISDAVDIFLSPFTSDSAPWKINRDDVWGFRPEEDDDLLRRVALTQR
jgi:transcriptional regulator with XRE-family HTH domain